MRRALQLLSVAAAMVAACVIAGPVCGQEAKHPFEDDPQITIYRDVVYGNDDAKQQVLDAYILKSDKPTPLLVKIHAGWSFSNHGRRSFKKRERLYTLVKEAGISVVSITHRDIKKYKFPAPMVDTGRAVQFVRSKAKQWNIDPEHIAAIGGSGGGHCATWVALHDDLANADSADPVARLSSRLQCVVPMWTPTDFTRFHPSGEGWKGNIAKMIAGIHGFKPEDYNKTPESKKVIAEASLTTLVSKDDPPVFLCYDGTAEMIRKDHPPAPKVINDPHHGWHGVLLADRLKAAGVEHVMFMGPNAKGKDRDTEIVKFLVKYLKPPKAGKSSASEKPAGASAATRGEENPSGSGSK